MSRFTKDSKYRLRDYSARKRFSSAEEVYLNGELGHEYIPIHPFACEKSELVRLGLTESSCDEVDAYWNMGSDVCFLRVKTKGNADISDQGVFIQWENTKKEYMYLVAFVDDMLITKSVFENVMVKIFENGIAATEQGRKKYTKKQHFVKLDS